MNKIFNGFFILAICFFVLPLFSQEIKNENGNYIIKGDNYVAKTSEANGGCLSSLVVRGVEFINQNIQTTNGTYFYNGGIVKADKVQLEGSKYTVYNSVGSITYDFKPSEINVSILCNTEETYYMIMEPFSAAKVGDEYLYSHFSDFKSDVTFYKKKSAINILGDFYYWGPWINNTQVLDMSLNKNETKTFTIKPFIIDENGKYYKTINHINADLNIYSPKNYEVFQRQSKDMGYIDINLKAFETVSDIQYKIEGKDYKGKSLNIGWKKLDKKFEAYYNRIPCPAGGWYKVSIKYLKDGKENIKVVENVGVGEIIIGAGQSNSTNYGETRTLTKTKMVATTNGDYWREGDDPMLGVCDNTTGGSFYPSLGDALYNEFKVPIGIASTGFGGTRTAEWLNESKAKTNYTLFAWFMKRVLKFGPYGFRCVIWHQGESDNGIGSSDKYYENLANIIIDSRNIAGWYIPWVTAKVSCWHEGGEDNNVRDGQQRIWDIGIAMEGPDTDILWGEEIREKKGTGVHFAKKGLEIHGQMWADVLIKYIHSQID